MTVSKRTRSLPLDVPTPAERVRAGTYTAKGHRAWKPSKARARQMREHILGRDGNECQDCGYHSESGLNLELDHVIPYKLGGFFITSNLAALCQQCNVMKGARIRALV